MSVPNEPIVPPSSPIDVPPPDPDRVPGDQPMPEPEPDEPIDPMIKSSGHCPTWSLLCRGIRLETEWRQ